MTRMRSTKARLLQGAMLLVAGVPSVHGADAHRVHAVVVSRESSVRTTITNQDIYLLQVAPRRGEAFTALAIDEYPYYGQPLPGALVSTARPVSLRLRRTPYCDRVMAKSNAGSEAALPCFTIEHDSWKVGRGIPLEETWWK